MARNAARSPAVVEASSQPVSQYSGAAAPPGSGVRQRVSPVVASRASIVCSVTVNTRPSPVAGVNAVATSEPPADRAAIEIDRDELAALERHVRRGGVEAGRRPRAACRTPPPSARRANAAAAPAAA